MSKKFNVGDNVRVVEGYTPDKIAGMVGVISLVRGQSSETGKTLSVWDYEVKFNKASDYLHRGMHSKITRLYRYFDSSELELVEAKSEAKTKYKVGDVVTVRSDLIVGYYEMANGSNRTRVSDQMLTKRGEKVTIESITKNGKYMVSGSMFVWTDGMFEDNVKAEPKKITEREPKIGDRIKLVKDYLDAPSGEMGTIKNIEAGYLGYSVEFDNKVGMHTCGGVCKFKYGLYLDREHFELFEEDTTPRLVCQVTFTEGGQMYSYRTEDTTITVGSEVTVPCGKGDHWSVATVQRIGYYTESDTPYPFDKMKIVVGQGEIEKPRPHYNGKVVCVKGNPRLNVPLGKIYEFVDGECIDGDGRKLTATPIEDINDLNRRFATISFIEIIE